MKQLFMLGIVTAACFMNLVSCGIKPKEIEAVSPSAVVEHSDESISIQSEYAEGEELFCLVATREDAQKIADMYGITLVTFDQGVATYHAEGNPTDIIAMGAEKGYPPLEQNSIVTAYDE